MFSIAIDTHIATAIIIAIVITIAITIYIAIVVAIDISIAIDIVIATDISIFINIDNILFNTTFTDYNWKIRKIERLCASNIASFSVADARVLAIERDTVKTIIAEIAVTTAIGSTIRKKQNLREAQHIEDADTLFKEVICFRSDIKSTKRATTESVCAINDEHNSCPFDENQ